MNQVIKRVAIRVAHPSNLKFPVSGSAWRPGEGKGRMHSCLLIGPPLDSNFCLQKREGGKGKGCLVPALCRLCSPRMDMPPQMSQHLVGPLLTEVSSALLLGTLAQLLKSFIFLSFPFLFSYLQKCSCVGSCLRSQALHLGYSGHVNRGYLMI